VAALIVVALGFYFIEVYAPAPANPILSAAIQQDSIPIGSMTREFLEYVPHDMSPHSPLIIVIHGSLMDAKSMREWTGYEFDQLADQHGFVVVYPDGYKHNWNDCHSKATFPAHTESIDDMGFVKGLIAREVAQRQIDGWPRTECFSICGKRRRQYSNLQSSEDRVREVALSSTQRGILDPGLVLWGESAAMGS
jgi:polyhydroxybutyrate depolymerase